MYKLLTSHLFVLYVAPLPCLHLHRDTLNDRHSLQARLHM
uniref:Uncharacterized protein n=1 Tax=Setaria viridis TaxID=4556 RepID=A0A4U6T7A7_SETVI|nr:hypothetical protein SEVIR_9G471750v2 [Setaria viridis]